MSSKRKLSAREKWYRDFSRARATHDGEWGLNEWAEKNFGAIIRGRYLYTSGSQARAGVVTEWSNVAEMYARNDFKRNKIEYVRHQICLNLRYPR